MNQPQQQPPQQPHQPHQPQQEPWRWHYSRWVGVMYGPIPVGVIVVAIGLIIYYASQN
jgi:hypothetical protein